MAEEKITEPISSNPAAKTWGRFQLVTLLGKGGMGDVYKAYDPTLKRYMALKILRHEEPETLQRFLREARAQAQVEHPNVCKIYESGEYNGHPYIAMQYIEGKNFKELNDKLTLEEKLYIVKEIALGLHAAHRQGLIHRDVKPANIMVASLEEGGWKPYIMDFGIAREQQASGLTSTGMVVGTPFYMAPEHARGKLENLDRRSDIYSLGVTLYELLSGDLPFQGETPVEVLIQVIERDPLPLRKVNPGIPFDVETIVMKCLEKDPNRRYNSAKELAEDIGRYLDGEPITARPTTITYRIKRKIIKNKWASIFIGAASLAIVVLFGLWLQAQWAASRRAAIAQQLGQEVEKIESTIHYAHLLPLHNISREKNIIRERIRTIDTTMTGAGKMGFGPSHYAMGRGFMALQEYEKAKYHLEQAWDANYQTPEVAYELGRALGELYLKESEIANRIENKELRDARKKKIENTFREPAVRFLMQAREIRDISQDYIVALVDFYKKNYRKALQILQAAMEKSGGDAPWLHEAKILEGNIYLTIGREKANYIEAMESFSRAEKVYLQVIEKGQSDIRGYMGLGRVLERKILIMLNSKGGDLQPLVTEAITQYEKALQIDPELVDVYVMKSWVYLWLGRSQVFAGKNPLEAFNQAITAAQTALKLQGDNFEAYTIVGITNRHLAEYQMQHGEDPTGAFQLAAWNFNKAIEFNPTYVMAYSGLGILYIRKAEYEMSLGQDTNESLEKSISTFKKALAINPQLLDLLNGLAGALWLKGEIMMSQGQDPRPTLLEAAQSLKNAIEVNPSVVHFYSNLGFVYMDMGRYELNYGFVPTGTLNKAREFFEKAVEINPGANELYVGLVSVSAIQTQYLYWMKKDCNRQVSQAEVYFKRGLEQNPDASLLYIRMAGIYITQARSQSDQGNSPLVILDRAEQLLRKARAINPNYYENDGLDGEISLLKAKWALENQQDPDAYFTRTAESLKQAMSLNPKNIDLYLIGARLNWSKAGWKEFQNQPTAALKYITAGLDYIRQALAINSNYAEAYALRGVLLRLRSRLTGDSTGRRADAQEAGDSLLKAFEVNRNLKNLFESYLKE